MICCPRSDHYAYDERVAIMIESGMDEARAIQAAMLLYAGRCYGCGREL